MARTEGLLLASGATAVTGSIDVEGFGRGRSDNYSLGGGVAYRAGEAAHPGFGDDSTPAVRVRSGPGPRLVPRPTEDPSWEPRTPTPAPRRFAAWSRRYVGKIAAADALVGALAAIVPASFSGTLREPPSTLLLLGLVGALIWPAAIGLSRGYQRTSVGVGSDELRAVLRAAAAIVVAGAFPAGLLDQRALLTLVVVATPMALALSLTTRFAARKILHHQQRRGRKVSNVVVVGSPDAAQQLRQRLDREPHCGMKVIGVCLPYPDLDHTVVPGSTGPRRSAERGRCRSPRRVRRRRGDHRRRNALQLPAGVGLGAGRLGRRNVCRSGSGRGGRPSDAHPASDGRAAAAHRGTALRGLATAGEAHLRRGADLDRFDRHLAVAAGHRRRDQAAGRRSGDLPPDPRRSGW